MIRYLLRSILKLNFSKIKSSENFTYFNLLFKQNISFHFNKNYCEYFYIFLQIERQIKWKQHRITVAGGGGQGNQLNQLSKPEGIFGISYFGRKDKMPIDKNVENKNEGVGGDL